jgi:4-hydroxy-3-methylbut-2-enyl diphosphate reductase
MVEKYGADHVKQHIADTRDTLCYATNDNQSATNGLLNSNADLALIVGGYNSSNTTHLVEILEQKFPTYFVQSHEEINSSIQIQSYDIHKKELMVVSDFLPLKNQPIHVALTSGASCPDAIVDRVIQRIVSLLDCPVSVEQAIDQFVNQSI